MRLTHAQIAVRLICGIALPRFVPNAPNVSVRIRDGHDQLVRLTGQDFGYDLQAWHDYLKVSRDGGYTYGRNIALPKIMKEALESNEWQEAVRAIQTRLCPKTV
jgi:hypothetical protein